MSIGTRIVRSSPYAFAGVKMEFGGDSHIFEAHGLGKAPFSYECAEPKPGNCQYCNKRLENRCWLRASDGRRFYVGKDCVEKHGGSALVELIKRHESAIRKLARTAEISISEARKLELAYRAKFLDEWNVAWGVLRKSKKTFHSFENSARPSRP